MTEQRTKAINILSKMLGADLAAQLRTADPSKQFAGRLGPMAMSNVFEPLWANEVLDVRTRSLVTIGMLIALRASEELEIHFPAAIRNGATVEELEEVIYQASGYAGFPAAHSASRVAAAALKRAGMID